jgi:hypothetical protein
MRNFIKLNKRIINKININEIEKNTNEYVIHVRGSGVVAWMMFGSGVALNNSERIKICKIKDECDYKIIQKFIDSE